MQTSPVDLGVLGARLRQQTDINDPMTGSATPLEVEARSKLWPHASRWSLIELKFVTDNGARRLEEYRFTPQEGIDDLPPMHGPGLPVAIMFERSPNGASRARIYSAHHLVADRARILAVDEHLQPGRGPDDILTRYFDTLHTAQLEPTLDLFDADGYLQHSNGETYRGREQLRVDFIKIYQTGGVILNYCNKTDDDRTTAYETYMPSGRPAVAVYERSRSNKLAAVRLYL